MLRLLRRRCELKHERESIGSKQVRAFGGWEQLGPSSVDRRDLGTKLTLMTRRNGVPLGSTAAGKTRGDPRGTLPIIKNEFPQVGG